MSKNSKKIAIVTGANRGIGFEICRQLAQQGVQVVLTSRNEEKGKAAAQKIREEGGEVIYQKLDVTSITDIEALKEFITDKLNGRCDILVNNAGVFLDKKDPYAFGGEFISFFDTNLDVVKKTMETNLYGPFLLYQAVVPFMKKNRYGRIVNMSSGLGQLAKMGSGYTAYRLSKTALNALTCILASELKDDNILVNSVNPGWVRTDMGGPMAPRDVAEGADTAVWLAMLPEDGPTGKFFRDRTEIMW